MAILSFSTVQAATITVTNVNDSGPGSLRQAVEDANNNGDPDNTIEFIDGLGTITLTSGHLEITKTLAIAPAEANDQVISGDDNSRIFAVTDANAELTLENLSLTNGRTTLNDPQVLNCGLGTGEGGAICSRGNLVLINTTVTNSSTTEFSSLGGAIYAAGDLEMFRSAVTNNWTEAAAASGGGVYVGGNATLIHSVISGNRTFDSNARGGGLFIVTSGSLTLFNSLVHDNQTQGIGAPGGGIYTGQADVALIDSTVADNATQGVSSPGGGLYSSRGVLLIINSTIADNRVTGEESDGGGIYRTAGNLAAPNSTISGNSTAQGAGAGIFLQHQAEGDFSVSLASTILAGNVGNGGNFAHQPVVDENGTVTLQAFFSLFGDDEIEINGFSLSNVFNDEPDLAVLADNGCHTPVGSLTSTNCVLTRMPNASSPAINAGDNTSLNLSYDQRGEDFPRTVGSQTDIGSIEVGVSAPVVPPPIAVPTHSRHGLGLLILLMAMLGWLGLRRT